MQKTLRLKTGQVVKSLAGRDEGKIFTIVEIVDEKYVKIVDGKLRKLEKPKLKKAMHLKPYSAVIDLHVENLNDSYIRKSLKIINKEAWLWQKKM